MTVTQFKTTAEVVHYVMDKLFSDINKITSQNNYFNLAVAGGSTVIPLFQAIAQNHAVVPYWGRVNFFWVDERWVPHHDVDSNYGAALRAGLNQIPANWHPIDTTHHNPEESCADYEKIITSVAGGAHQLDQIVLGVGEDGHVASIFSGDISAAQQGIVMNTQHPLTQQPRIGLTLQALSQAKQVSVLILGERKRNILQALINGQQSELPIVALAALRHDLDVITDIHD